jgi:hypothetical protein
MGEPRVNREKWAELVGKLLVEEAGGNKTRLAELLGVDRRTVNRWIGMQGDVSEQNVREAARRMKLPPRALLLEVGYYAHDELAELPALTGSMAGVVADEPALELIASSTVTPAIKRELEARVAKMRTDHEAERAETIRQLLDIYARAARRS